MGFHRHVAATGFASEVADREPSDELEMLEDFPPLGLDEISKYRKKHDCEYESPMLEGDRQSVNLRISGKRTLFKRASEDLFVQRVVVDPEVVVEHRAPVR
jgi:hypothetical protein